MEITREKREAQWLKILEVIAVGKGDEVMCPTGDLNANVGDVKIICAIGDFLVEWVN